MRIAAVRLRAYRLGLTRPWRSHGGTLGHRQGWLLRLDTDRGISGFGECAPWQAFGTEDQDQAGRALQAMEREVVGRDVMAMLSDQEAWRETPAAHAAMETALLDLLARQAGVPLATWLNPSANGPVPVNAVLGALDGQILERCRDALDAGYRVLKVKLGVLPWPEEWAALRALAGRLPPAAVLRLDANGAWSESEFQRILRFLKDLPVESLEEPLRDPDWSAYARLQARCAFPLALDESFSYRSHTDFSRFPVRRLVLKLPRVGGPGTAFGIAGAARKHGVKSVISSLVEGAAGLCAAAQVAAALDNGLAHGLATSSWLSENLGPVPPIEGGALSWRSGPGLGFEPFRELSG